ncbi:hypothetical protein [Methanosalsum zhilinae]|nr:hypothetical protein [Methanosalsum zhilinae]
MVDENDIEPEKIDDLDEEVPGFTALMSLFVFSIVVVAVNRFRKE